MSPQLRVYTAAIRPSTQENHASFADHSALSSRTALADEVAAPRSLVVVNATSLRRRRRFADARAE